MQTSSNKVDYTLNFYISRSVNHGFNWRMKPEKDSRLVHS